MPLKSTINTVRPNSRLPFYCRPLELFVTVWAVMLFCFQFQVSKVSYPDFSLALMIFLGSLAAFALGHFATRLVCKISVQPTSSIGYEIKIKRLRKFNFILFSGAALLIAMNLILSGLPPFFGFFGISTMDYIEYGKLKQMLFPLLMILFVDSFLETSWLRKMFYSSFAFLGLLFYVARGSIMIVLLQALIVFSIRTSIGKIKLYAIAIGGLVGAAFLVDIIGKNRTGDVIFFAYMQIKTQFQSWPTIYLWMISYISTPISNLCWFVDQIKFDHPTMAFAYSLLPSFWQPLDPHIDISQTSKIIDGTHTYLASYFFDFSYAGIAFINFIIGIVSGFCSSARRLSRNFLCCSVFLGCLGFMFFTDFFLYLQTFLELGLQGFAQYYFIRQILPPKPHSSIKIEVANA